MPQPRQPRGVPAGGQWRAARRPEGVVDLSARSEVGPLQMVGTTTGPFTWSPWPDDWQQYTDEPPGLAAGARAGAGTRLWAEVQKADGRWAWSVERLVEAGGDLHAHVILNNCGGWRKLRPARSFKGGGGGGRAPRCR